MTDTIMNLQEAKEKAFEIVYKGFEAQGWVKSYLEDADICRYRLYDKDNKLVMCAASHLIRQEEYSADMEGCSADVLDWHRIMVDPLRDWFNNSASHEGRVSFKTFVSQMQRLHDNSAGDTLKEVFDRNKPVLLSPPVWEDPT